MRRNVLCVTLVTLHYLGAFAAAETPGKSLLSRQDWVRFDIILGRLTATHLRAGNGRSADTSETRRESLAICSDPTRRSIRYNCADERRSIELRIAEDDVQFEKRPAPNGPGAYVSFVQQPGQPIALSVGGGAEQQVHRAASIWHLLLAEPDVCQAHLVPLMQLLRPDWRVVEMAGEVEAALFRAAQQESRITPEQVARLVHELDHSEFARRQAADRRIRDLGVAMLPYLVLSQERPLSGEQRVRISRIRDDLSAAISDTPIRVGTWLANDPSIWLTLLSHHEPIKRQAAADQLAGIHASAIRFDPLAAESTRRRQITELRTHLCR